LEDSEVVDGGRLTVDWEAKLLPNPKSKIQNPKRLKDSEVVDG
jgi:hypothetical protein